MMLSRRLALAALAAISPALAPAAGPTPSPAPAAVVMPAAAAPDTDVLSKTDMAAATETDSMSIPTPGELFAALGKQMKPNWASQFRGSINTSLASRAQIALNLGGLIADGYVAVEAMDSSQVKNVGRDILILGKSLGISKEIIERGQSITNFAEANEWNTLKEELEATQNEVKSAMSKLRDEDLVTLISLGGWIRGTAVVCGIIGEGFSDASASLIRQPAVVGHLRRKIATLSPKVRDDVLIQSVDRQLAEIEKLVSFPLGTAPSKEDVKKLKDSATALVVEIGKKS